MKRYKSYFGESNMKITTDTQKVIQRYIKDKKYISDSNTLKVSFQDMVVLIYQLQDEYKKNRDPKILQAIKELEDERFK